MVETNAGLDRLERSWLDIAIRVIRSHRQKEEDREWRYDWYQNVNIRLGHHRMTKMYCSSSGEMADGGRASSLSYPSVRCM